MSFPALNLFTVFFFLCSVEIRNAIYDQLGRASTEDGELLGSALSQLQVDFIKSKNQQLKSLMKLVKFWAQKGFVEKDNQNLPSPYLLELVTIFCWEHASSPETFKFASAFRAVLLTLEDHKSLKAVWNDNYSWEKAQEVTHLERLMSSK
jgi:hypothetical protein